MVGANLAGFNVLINCRLCGNFTHTPLYTEWYEKQKTSCEWKVCWLKHHVKEQDQPDWFVLTGSLITQTIFCGRQKKISESTTHKPYNIKGQHRVTALLDRNQNLNLLSDFSHCPGFCSCSFWLQCMICSFWIWCQQRFIGHTSVTWLNIKPY